MKKGNTALLTDITVLDLTQYLPGPLATKTLSDLGAEVIKIETADGDLMRNIPPFDEHHVSLPFASLNTGKKSLRLDLSSEDGQEILTKLIKTADVLIHSYPPARAEKLNLTFERIQKVNDSIIFAELVADFEHPVGHDLNFMALSGALSLMQRNGKNPMNGSTNNNLPFFQVADLMGGATQTAVTLLAALVRRGQSDEAHHLKISMLEGTRYYLELYFSALRENHTDTLDILRGKAPCYNIYECSDGKKIALAALEPDFWINLCHALDRDDLLEKQFSESEVETMKEIFSQKSRAEWLSAIPIDKTTLTPVLDLEEYQSPETFPSMINRVRLELADQSPQLSEHAEEILDELGYDKQTILRLRSEEII